MESSSTVMIFKNRHIIISVGQFGASVDFVGVGEASVVDVVHKTGEHDREASKGVIVVPNLGGLEHVVGPLEHRNTVVKIVERVASLIIEIVRLLDQIVEDWSLHFEEVEHLHRFEHGGDVFVLHFQLFHRKYIVVRV